MGLRSFFTTGSWSSSTGVRSALSNNFLSGVWSSNKVASGVSVTKSNAMTIAGVYSAVRVITDAVSSLPIHVINDNGTTKTKEIDHPISTLLSKEPNNLMTSFIWRQIIMPHVLLWGNSYNVIEFAGGGSRRPISILPVHPSKVEVMNIDGLLWYKIKIEGAKDLMVDQSNILHFRGLGDEIIGRSVIDHAKENLGLGKAAEQFGSTFFGNGANMHGVLSSDKGLTDKAITNLRASVDTIHGGISRSNKILILEEGLKFTNTSIPPDAAQFLETRKFSITDIARWFKVPPHKIGDLERATFSNIEEMELSFAKESLLPYILMMEQEIDRKLFRESEKRTMYSKMNLDGLLRGDIKTRYEAHKIGIQNGFITPNEARAKEEMNPIEGLDTTWMQLNTAPVVNGTNQPEQINNNTDEES